MEMTDRIIKLADHSQCTGCGACADACSTNSIRFIANGLHQFPVINKETCVNCGRCVSCCPSLSTPSVQSDLSQQRYYACWNKDREALKSSTSGGIGTALSLQAINDGYIVAGSVLNKEGRVIHRIAKTISKLDGFKGSKYVQSDCVGIYRECVSELRNGGKVFFIGTPCQVEGFKKTVPLKYMESVLTCSIICHGVNSPIVWDDYRSYLEKKYGSKLAGYNFRSKSKGWQKKNGGPNLRVSMKFDNGKSIDLPSWKNLFHCWFGQHFILRASCLRCKYRTEERNSDLVIGDFWGIDKILPQADTRNGVSVLITTSKTGEDFFRKLSNVELIAVDASKAKQVLRGFINKKSEDAISKEEARRTAFEKEYVEKGFAFMMNKYPSPSNLDQVISFIKSKFHLK